MIDTLKNKTITLETSSNIFNSRKNTEVIVNSSKAFLDSISEEGLNELLSLCLKINKRFSPLAMSRNFTLKLDSSINGSTGLNYIVSSSNVYGFIEFIIELNELIRLIEWRKDLYENSCYI